MSINKGNNYKHGMCKAGQQTRFWKIWAGMKNRCLSSTTPCFHKYGGRGIKVCERWMKFENFYEDMKEGYTDKLTLERKNNNGNYELSNCRWATWMEQQNNKRNSVFIEYGGLKLTVSQWARKLGFNPKSFRHRLERGWSIEDAIETPKLS